VRMRGRKADRGAAEQQRGESRDQRATLIHAEP
jgi:hypothetical protein